MGLVVAVILVGVLMLGPVAWWLIGRSRTHRVVPSDLRRADDAQRGDGFDAARMNEAAESEITARWQGP